MERELLSFSNNNQTKEKSCTKEYLDGYFMFVPLLISYLCYSLPDLYQTFSQYMSLILGFINLRVSWLYLHLLCFSKYLLDSIERMEVSMGLH